MRRETPLVRLGPGPDCYLEPEDDGHAIGLWSALLLVFIGAWIAAAADRGHAWSAGHETSIGAASTSFDEMNGALPPHTTHEGPGKPQVVEGQRRGSFDALTRLDVGERPHSFGPGDVGTRSAARVAVESYAAQ